MTLRAFRCTLVLLLLGTTVQADEPDPRYRTPRATVRTLYIAADLAREDPRHVATAAGCLDFSGVSSGTRLAGMIADRLEGVLVAKEVLAYQVPDDASLEEYVIPDASGHRLVLRKMPDGCFRFDRDTVAGISRTWADLQKTIRAKNQEAAALNVRPEFASPRAALRAFLQALRRDDLDAAADCLDLHDIPSAARREVGYQLARRLKQVLDRTRLVIPQQVPDTNHAPPYVWHSQSEGLIELARQYSGPRKGEWLFSTATVRSIDSLYESSEGKPYVPEVLELVNPHPEPSFWHAPELWLRSRLPSWAAYPVINTRAIRVRLYEVAGLAFLLLTVVGVYKLTLALLVRLAGSALRLASVTLTPTALRRRLRASARLASIAYLHWGVLLLALDRGVLAGILVVLMPLLWLSLAWAVFRLIDLFGDAVEARLGTCEDHAVTAQMLLPVGSLLLKIIILLGTLFELMYLFDWDVTTVLTGLGIGGLAFALGAQDSLKNLFGSLTLIADRPFVVGERVRIGQRDEGVVEMVGLRSTRIRTFEDALLTVPNSDLTTMHITNFGRRRACRYNPVLSVVYSTPPQRLLGFCDGIREIILAQEKTRKDKFSVRVHDLGVSAIEVRLDVFFDVTDREQELIARETLILAVLALAEQLGVEFAFPTQTVHVAPPAVHLSAHAGDVAA